MSDVVSHRQGPVNKPPRPQTLHDFRMQEVSFEIEYLDPGATLFRRSQIAGYFYHVLEGSIQATDASLTALTAEPRDTLVVGGVVEHSVTNAAGTRATMLVGSEPFEYLTWLPASNNIDCFRGDSAHPLTKRLLLAMELVLEEISNPETKPDQLTLERAAELIIFYFFRMANPVTGELDPFPWSDKRLMTAVSAMQQDPARDWTVDQLAEIAHMSRSAFSERFKKALNDSPIRMLAEIRLKRAARELLEGKTIAEASAGSGYGSAEALNRAFKRQFGVTPGRWLREKSC